MQYHLRTPLCRLRLIDALSLSVAAFAIVAIASAAPPATAPIAEADPGNFEPPSGMSMAEVLDTARLALLQEQDAEATERYLWLWDHMQEKEPAMYAVRLSFMAADIQKLVERHQPARRAFEARRDALQPPVEGQPSQVPPFILADWIVLNEIIGDDASTLRWWDQVKDRLDDPNALQRVRHVEHRLRRILLDDLRWKELARLYANPLGHVRDRYRFYQLVTKLNDEQPLDELPEDMQAEIHRRQQQAALGRFREEVAVLYAALLASEREEDAVEVADLAIRLDPSPPAMRMALVDMAIGAGEPRANHREWLDEAAEEESLKADVEQLRTMLENAAKSKDAGDEQ